MTAIIGIAIAVVAYGIFAVNARIDDMSRRIESLSNAMENAVRSIDTLGDLVDDIDELVTLSAPEYARDRIAFRRAVELTLDSIRLWQTGQVFRLIEADWALDSDSPMISRYYFRFRQMGEHDPELGTVVNGEWRFSVTEEWKHYSFRARETSSDARRDLM